MTIDIEKLRAAHAATTQGEWDWHLGTSVEQDDFATVEIRRDGEMGDVEILLEGPGERAEDVEFIALAHNEFPAMLDEIQKLRALLSRTIEVFDDTCDCGECGPCKLREEIEGELK